MFRYATSLSARHGVLWVARWGPSWRVVPHDFDGRELSPGFVVPPENGTRAAIASIAVDEDRRVWVVDTEAQRVRAFTAFGRELAGLPRGHGDRVGSIAEAVAVDASGVEASAQLVIASSGARRHALHLARGESLAAVSLRPRDVAEGFAGLGRVAFGVRGLVYACEPSSGLVLAWREGEFHFAFRAPEGRAPIAVRALDDGRMVVASAGDDGGAVHLVDAAGRLLRTLARGGEGEGLVTDPEDLAVEFVAGSERRTRVVVADAAGARLQVFNLEGDCYGAFGADADASERSAGSS
ncbi:MAG: hypothetical protein NTY35_11915 [Planctomycetota bacterium]|nr:hypothetical protein [Planctomycetota bacterium]